MAAIFQWAEPKRAPLSKVRKGSSPASPSISGRRSLARSSQPVARPGRSRPEPGEPRSNALWNAVHHADQVEAPRHRPPPEAEQADHAVDVEGEDRSLIAMPSAYRPPIG
jgi:hypothetical protein